jgi:hypothetical protein
LVFGVVLGWRNPMAVVAGVVAIVAIAVLHVSVVLGM